MRCMVAKTLHFGTSRRHVIKIGNGGTPSRSATAHTNRRTRQARWGSAKQIRNVRAKVVETDLRLPAAPGCQRPPPSILVPKPRLPLPPARSSGPRPPAALLTRMPCSTRTRSSSSISKDTLRASALSALPMTEGGQGVQTREPVPQQPGRRRLAHYDLHSGHKPATPSSIGCCCWRALHCGSCSLAFWRRKVAGAVVLSRWGKWTEGLTDNEARSKVLINVIPEVKQRSCSEKKLARMLRQLSIVCVQVKNYSVTKNWAKTHSQSPLHSHLSLPKLRSLKK